MIIPEKSNNQEKKYSPLNQALMQFLPELMNRNLKKGERLKSKVEVSFLLNNIELRNQSYLKKLVTSSEKTLQSVKSGLDFKKAMELSEEKLHPLNYQILDDYFLRKNGVISGTKIQLGKNTEEESNGIIKSGLNIIKYFLNPTNKNMDEPEIELPKKKYLTKAELIEDEKIIKKILKQEANVLNTRVKKYLNTVNKIKLTKPRENNNVYDPKWIKVNKEKNREFYFYADNVEMNSNDVKMIHYKKLEPIPIRDKSCPNLKDIKERLFPDIKEGKAKKDSYINIKNCNSVKIINGMKMQKNYEEKKLMNKSDIYNIKVNPIKRDSYNTLNRIVLRNNSLTNLGNVRYRKLSSLMDIKLPKLSDYDLMISKRKSFDKEEKNEENNNIKTDELMKNCYKWKLMPEITTIKEEIKNLQSQKIDIEQNYIRHKEEILNKTYLIPGVPIRKIKKNSFELTNNEGIFNLNIKPKIKKAKKITILPYETPSIRMPSSYSVNLLKRKSRIETNIHNIMNNKLKRDYSNISAERTNVSSIIPSVANSATSSLTTNKKERKFNKFLKKIDKEGKKYMFGKPVLSLKTIKKNFVPISSHSNNNNSSVISNFSD